MLNNEAKGISFYDLGHLNNQDSMIFFHALASQGEEALVIVSPSSPIVSVGYFQDTPTSVDLDYCRENKIPIMRRMIGGGTTLLDCDQIFYQVILKAGNPLISFNKEQFYRAFSIPAIKTYIALGIDARYRPINDIITRDGRKIAGQGTGEIGECIVFVGGILLDFDYELMSRVLKVPDEKFRDKVYKSMKDNLTTVKKELGVLPNRQDVVDSLKVNWEEILGELIPKEFGIEEERLIEEVATRIDCDDFLFSKKRRDAESIRVSSEALVYKAIGKAKGGLIQAIVEVKDNAIYGLEIYGDFMSHPAILREMLEIDLIGVSIEEKELTEAISSIYNLSSGELLGISPHELARILLRIDAC